MYIGRREVWLRGVELRATHLLDTSPFESPIGVMKILSSSSDLNQPTLNGSQRRGVLPKVFLQRRRDFVGVPVPVGEKQMITCCSDCIE
jgi:hypothetical protein